MPDLLVSRRIGPGRPIHLNLDDLEAILAALERNAGSVRILMGDRLLGSSAELADFVAMTVTELDVETHAPYVRLRFLPPYTEGQAQHFELSAASGDPGAVALFDRVEEMIASRERREPFRTWLREEASRLDGDGGRLLTTLVILLIVGALAALAFSFEFGAGVALRRALSWALAMVLLLTLLIAGAAYATWRSPSIVLSRGSRKKPSKRRSAEAWERGLE